ncbi:MAG: hypothetical protein F6J90_09430 [Moorea sp. SIOASIH]|nr:hypothetical protein [Moorena sp. SIOASIH]
MGRWGDGEMVEIFIKDNYPDMILLQDRGYPECSKKVVGITQNPNAIDRRPRYAIDRRSRGARSHLLSLISAFVFEM